MTEIQLTDTGDRLEVEGGLKYTFQNSEIGDLSEIMSNWAWTFDIKDTPKNKLILDGLGLVGSMSNAPYEKINCCVIYKSEIVIKKANLKITEYSNEAKRYKATVNSGIVDFFNTIENDKLVDIPSIMSRDAGLSHDKNLANIVNSWTGSGPYRYIIADYNGKINSDPNDVDFDSAYLVPSVNVKWLMDEIFSNYGWTYLGLPDIDKDWMTYSNKLEEAGDVGAIVGLLTSDPLEFTYGKTTKTQYKQMTIVTPSAQDIDAAYIINNGTDIEINQTEEYRIDLPELDYSNMPEIYEVKYSLRRNGVEIAELSSGRGISLGTLNVGDKISIFVFLSAQKTEYNYTRDLIFRGPITFTATQVTITDAVSPSLNQKVSEFLKEVMMRYAVVAIADPIDKEIKFYDIDDRLSFPVEDWTKKRVKRISESYAYQDYAMANFLRHTYETEGQDYHDGNFRIDNQNLESTKTLFQSKGFSSNENLVSFDVTNAFPMPAYKSYDIEQTNQGEKYKPLNSRFSFLRETYAVENPRNPFLPWQIKINGNLQTSFSFAIPRDFDVIVDSNYEDINLFLRRVKIVEMDLLLTFLDIRELSFEKRYYFEQEKSFFLLNKLTWDSAKKIHKGEFLKITTDG